MKEMKVCSYTRTSKQPKQCQHCTYTQVKTTQPQMEILVSKYTEVETSDKVFDVDSVAATSGKAAGKVITLSELDELVQFQRVMVEVKAIRVDEVMEILGGKEKQDILVGDSSGTARFTVWEGEIGKVGKGCSYRLSSIMVWEFRGKKFLSTSKAN